MSKILLRLFKFCHPAFFFYFNSFMLCKCFQSLSNNSFERVRPVIELQEDSSDFSNGENPGREEDLIADVLNGETLLFLTYKIDTREVADEICEVNKTHEVICNCDSGSPEDYSPNDADDEKFENTKTNDEEEKIEMQSEENELPRKRPKLEEKNDGESGEEIGMPRKQELDGKEGEKGDEERKDQFMAMVQYTAETTSKSSWEWRSSTNYRDSEMEDLYSSSSYSVDSLFIKKYDEEMLFYDKISAQKLQETESFRMMNPLPSSISKRIMINLRGYLEETQRLREDVRNPQQELEAAYVAQICLTWEALNWNYKNFKKLKAGKEDGDSGYYAHVAQQFQQFQVLLQRFIEVEPYERGRRPEIYARMRISRPKLLQVPELREGNMEGEANKETKISTAELLELMEESIKIFMEFLKAEKEDKCVIFRTLCRRMRRSRYSSRIRAVRKAARKKKKALKEMQKRWKCFTRRLKWKKAEQFEVLLALIDVKVVLRVLKMANLNEEQLHWCEEKINKLRVEKDKIQRDSCPLFYPCR